MPTIPELKEQIKALSPSTAVSGKNKATLEKMLEELQRPKPAEEDLKAKEAETKKNAIKGSVSASSSHPKPIIEEKAKEGGKAYDYNTMKKYADMLLEIMGAQGRVPGKTRDRHDDPFYVKLRNAFFTNEWSGRNVVSFSFAVHRIIKKGAKPHKISESTWEEIALKYVRKHPAQIGKGLAKYFNIYSTPTGPNSIAEWKTSTGYFRGYGEKKDFKPEVESAILDGPGRSNTFSTGGRPASAGATVEAIRRPANAGAGREE